MPKTLSWVGSHVEIEPTRRPKKLTGTRFASVLGLSPWASPFETWCAVTRTYEEPFTDTIYTAAGKVIEPKQAEYMRKTYLMNLTSPTDLWGEDYFKKTHGDFFPENKVLGGLWDFLLLNPVTKKPEAVFEMKTTKRAEDWAEDIPEYYALQAALYAYLLGVDQVYMVCSLLNKEDYEHPEDFKPSANNTFVRPFRVSERYPRMEALVKMALDWWKTYVTSGISPDYNEQKDAEILKALRTVETPEPTEDVASLLKKADEIQQKLEEITKEAAPLEKELKGLKDSIKTYLTSTMSDNDVYAVAHGPTYSYKLTKTKSIKLDEKRLKSDGLYDQYITTTFTYRMTVEQNEEEQ